MTRFGSCVARYVSGGFCALRYMCRDVSVPRSSVPGGICAGRYLCGEISMVRNIYDGRYGI